MIKKNLKVNKKINTKDQVKDPYNIIRNYYYLLDEHEFTKAENDKLGLLLRLQDIRGLLEDLQMNFAFDLQAKEQKLQNKLDSENDTLDHIFRTAINNISDAIFNLERISNQIEYLDEKYDIEADEE